MLRFLAFVPLAFFAALQSCMARDMDVIDLTGEEEAPSLSRRRVGRNKRAASNHSDDEVVFMVSPSPSTAPKCVAPLGG